MRVLVLAGLAAMGMTSAATMPFAVGAEPERAELQTAPLAEAAATKGPKVICVVDWGPRPTGAYRHKPRKCTLHERDSFPVGGYNTSSISRMNWKRWNGNRASGRGKIGISTAGLMNAKVKLYRPRDRCGEKVFTKAQVKFWGKTWMGDHIKDKYKMPLDTCLR